MSTSSEPSDPLALVLPPALVDLVAERVLAQLSGPALERWVGVREAAEHLGCRPQRIYDLVSRRATSGIPHRKEGTRVLCRLSELDRWTLRVAARRPPLRKAAWRTPMSTPWRLPLRSPDSVSPPTLTCSC